jgi:hypothetical protein
LNFLGSLKQKNAKKYEDEAKHSFQTIKKLGNPEDTKTKFLALKREQKVKKSGTKLQKLMHQVIEFPWLFKTSCLKS